MELKQMKPLNKLFENLLDKAGPAAKQLQRYQKGGQLQVSMMDRVLIGVALIGFFAVAMCLAGRL